MPRKPFSRKCNNCDKDYLSLAKQFCSKACYWIAKKGEKKSLETRKKMSEFAKKRFNSPEGRRLQSLLSKGRVLTEEHRKNISNARKGKFGGSKSHFWKGGITLKQKLARKSTAYKNWRKSVFERDNYACVQCLFKSQHTTPLDIQADHIKQFAFYPELRFEI